MTAHAAETTDAAARSADDGIVVVGAQYQPVDWEWPHAAHGEP
ncbi:hypothetical protein SAMN04487751_0011 [Microbacterium saccharophilum]|uniref:Uncharacterized protein n=1 Tax=Microbacterium saccharophilum TaxID=1213358 RepID=A0A7Z7GBU4_9MICO|nr:hypothetical protein SAMN04487751_0011 [Microbacterium saccharophilum]